MLPSIWRPQIVRSSIRTASRRHLASWQSRLSDPAEQFQIYTSKSRDPFINLSIEHYLFQKSPPGSKILFLYTNRPCIVIGRNQNPWLEVNLNLLKAEAEHDVGSEPPALGDVKLVRRRSGGGTVFHDEGNVNWTVICDFMEFTRDKHAEMVVRALRKLGVARARVNERHDIVLDQGKDSAESDLSDTHRTPYTSSDIRPLKVSGSAYKMARNRALHHGTALLQSPNLDIIPQYLHSPGKNYITAKGVESVSSPVGNINIGNETFIDAVKDEYLNHYNVANNIQEVELDLGALDIPEIRKGHDELTSPEWTFLQTPSFTFSYSNSIKTEYTMHVQHGVVKSCEVVFSGNPSPDRDCSNLVTERMKDRKIHEIDGWGDVLEDVLDQRQIHAGQSLPSFMDEVFPRWNMKQNQD